MDPENRTSIHFLPALVVVHNCSTFGVSREWNCRAFKDTSCQMESTNYSLVFVSYVTMMRRKELVVLSRRISHHKASNSQVLMTLDSGRWKEVYHLIF